MSQKKAVYNGPSGTGVDLLVTFPDGSTEPVHVDPGHHLPSEVNGRAVPAAFRDSLLEQDGWGETKQSNDTKKEEG